MVNKPEGKCTSEPPLLPVSCYHIADQTFEPSSLSHEFFFQRCPKMDSSKKPTFEGEEIDDDVL
jgi:hypothetical protein